MVRIELVWCVDSTIYIKNRFAVILCLYKLLHLKLFKITKKILDADYICCRYIFF